jgi:hypothetical protein
VTPAPGLRHPGEEQLNPEPKITVLRRRDDELPGWMDRISDRDSNRRKATKMTMPPVSVGDWRTSRDGETWRPLEATQRTAETGWTGNTAAIEVRGEQHVDGSIDWYVSIPEGNLIIPAQHLGQWLSALAAAKDEIDLFEFYAGTTA